jgi:hypothetical protein
MTGTILHMNFETEGHKLKKNQIRLGLITKIYMGFLFIDPKLKHEMNTSKCE